MASDPTVVSAAKLASRLAQGEDLLVVQVTSRQVYDAAHIEGSHCVEPAELVSGVPPATGRLPDAGRLAALFGRLGLGADPRVVTLDDEGGGWAGRLAWTLDVLGRRDWIYLDGGLHAWHQEGLPLVSGPSVAQARPAGAMEGQTPSSPEGASASGGGVSIAIDQGPIAEAEDILERLGDPDLTVWDCRSWEEYKGQRAAAARAGHIPGAVHLDWLELMQRDRGLRLVDDIAGLLERRGIGPQQDVIAHCQTHHRSGLAYMVARILGFPRIRAYHGSWAEWGNRPDTPVET